MIDKICEIALAHNPNKYISAIVKHEKAYEIIMVDKEKDMSEDLLFEKNVSYRQEFTRISRRV